MNSDVKKIIAETTQSILGFLGLNQSSNIELIESEASLVVSISSEDKMGFLIGKNGQNISAIEHLLRAITFKKISQQSLEPASFSLDINDYRKLKSDNVIRLAKEVANKVSSTRRSEALLPMNAYERRLVHAELASMKDIETESIGEEPRRRIIIKPAMEI